MEAKEKVIAEKWIEAVGAERYENMKGLITPNGYYKSSKKMELGDYFDYDFYWPNTIGVPYRVFLCRPNTLSGIENNRNWIRVKSEKDIPTSSKLYKSGYLNPENGEWIEHRTKDTTEQLKTAYWAKCITHIKEITVDLPPLF